MRSDILIYDPEVEIKVEKHSPSSRPGATHLVIKEINDRGIVDVVLFRVEPRKFLLTLRQAISEYEKSLKEKEEKEENDDLLPEQHQGL